MQEGCIMLFTYYSFFLFRQNEKGLFNFVLERIIFLNIYICDGSGHGKEG